MHQQNGAHAEGESVWHLELEGDNPGPEPKSGCRQGCQDSALLRYVRHLSFATYYDVVLVPLGQNKEQLDVFQEITGLGI